jgi:hypothetical protein
MGLLSAKRLILFIAAAAAAAVLVLTLTRGEDGRDGISLAACLEHASEALTPGTEEAGDPDAAQTGELDAGEAGDRGAALEGGECALRVHPETFGDLSRAHDAGALRLGADSTSDYVAATKLRARAEHQKAGPVNGADGRWKPVGKGPLHTDDPTYPNTYGTGFAELAGRISDYSYDSKRDRLYASVASGGVWESGDKGKHWHSIGDRLPTQTVGSIAYSTAHGGTLIAVTGDNAFGGNTYGGLGVYRSTNDGRSWQRSRGVPRGLQGFKAAVDPTNPNVIYAATGGGLFRSSNAGSSFTNVNLPIGGPCQGTTFRKPNCFFANAVTDVVVEAPDDFGNEGGTVLAAIGWRAGDRENFNGVPESPANGLYRSTSGRPGTFDKLDVDTNGFAERSKIGRVEMGAATGPDQNHDFVYALVQDAELFNSGTLEGLDVPDIGGEGLNATPTYFNGVYVSDDFGKTWTLMESRQELLLPTSGSTLAQLTPLGFGPGIQAWYDMWIKPDPTRQLNGVPTRVVFGLEELYKNTLPLPQNGHSNFKTIGAYNANGGPCLLVLATPVCSELQNQTQLTTTHPDQHAGTFIPDGNGGVTAIAGNDGGNYTQHTDANGDLTQSGWGKGDQLGFHTLLPYGVTAAKDGVIYAGLQDNGEIRIDPDTGKQNEVYGGDGIFTRVDPKNSDIVYEETPEAGINVSTDGGVNWTDISPLVDNPSFYSPIAMDPKEPDHLVSGGKQIVETTDGPNTTSPGITPADTDWQTVFNLRKSKRKVKNQLSAVDIRGRNVYAGYCGGCDVVRDKVKFFSGIATNVGRKTKPKPETSKGWHKVPAKGLPQRFISDITIDPRDRKTIYVTLGASDLRPYAPPKAEGHSGIARRGGHIYKSTDGGHTFHDISGNLEKVPALWSMIHRGQLVVATTVGVFASAGRSGGHYALLGKGLPRAPVFSLNPVPGHRNQILAASLGRGVYRYTFR